MTAFYNNQIYLLAISAMLIVCTQQQRSVVIIGAGPAGLAAASRLLEHNLTDITILEAEDRIGGRVHSVGFGEAIVELGAEWCHGEVGNVVFEMVKDLDMLEDIGDGMNIAFANGKILNNNQSSGIVGVLLEVYQKSNEEYVNASSGEYFSEVFPNILRDYFKDDEETLELALKSMTLYEKFILSLESAFSWHDVASVSSFEECEGNFNLAWKGKGYKQIFDVMAKKIPKSAGPALPVEDKVHLNKVVLKIDYSGLKPVVTCTDGSEYTSDYVIFTPSLGVLKHHHNELFHPILSQAKISAIEDMGFGAVNKILQSYADVWWPRNLPFGFAFSWTKEDNEEAAKIFAHGPIKDGKSWVSAILSILPAEHNPHVICIWMVGTFVPEIEKLSDEEIQKGISYVFNKFLGQRFNITKPDKMLRYGWYSNPHFHGTYSYESVRSRRDGETCHNILAEPVNNAHGQEVLLFAGEATNNIHFSTVHGAIESGYREADRIISKK